MSGYRKVGHLMLLLRRPQVEIEIIWSMDCKTFTNLNSDYFVLKSSVQKKSKPNERNYLLNGL